MRLSEPFSEKMRRARDGVAAGVAPLSGGRRREGRGVEAVARRRSVDRQVRWRRRARAGDAGAGDHRAVAAGDGGQRRAAATVMC